MMKNSKRQKLKLGVLWADPYCDNLGVAALAYSTIILFEEVSSKIGIELDYTLWGSRYCRHGIIDVGNGKCEIPIRTVRSFIAGDFLDFCKRCLRKPIRFGSLLFILDFFHFDLVADIGAGDSYSDIYGIARFRSIDFTKWWSHKLHKKYILLPQTLGPFISKEAHVKAMHSMKNADLIFARDKMSYDCAQKMLPDKFVEQTIDVAFFLPYTRMSFEGNKIKVGVNISGLLWHGGYTKDNQFGLKSDYQHTMYAILDYFSSRSEVELHLISHVIGKQDPIDEDSHVVKELANKYPQAMVAPAFSNPIEAKSYISGMDFFTGARMHACIAAISSGVPVYPLAYSRKFNGLFCDTLGYSSIASLTEMCSDEILIGVCSSYSRRGELKKDIEQIDKRIIELEKEKMINVLATYLAKYEF